MDGVTKRRTMASITTDRRVKNIFAISYCDKYRPADEARRIAANVLGLNYLDGMSKSAADGDTVACAAAARL